MVRSSAIQPAFGRYLCNGNLPSVTNNHYYEPLAWITNLYQPCPLGIPFPIKILKRFNDRVNVVSADIQMNRQTD